MIDLGIVKPGSTLYVPFASFSGSTGASSAMTGLATSDIQVYKDGGTNQRASASGFTLLDTDGLDFDTLTGINGISIDLADNTTAGFWAAGSRYWIVIADVTVDSQTVRFVAATFTIGLPAAVLNTTIATLSSQTSFTLTAGPAEDDALNGCVVYIHDVASAVQGGFAVVQDYTGSTKTVTLVAGTTFTAAAADNICVLGPTLMPTVLGRTLDVSAGGEAGVDWANVGSPTTTVGLSGTTVKTATDVETDTADIQSRLPAALVSGRMDSSVGAMAADVITAAATAADFKTEVTSGLSTLDAAGVRTAVGLASADLDTQLAALPTAAENADAVWDEAIAGHAGAGSTGEALSAAGSAGDPWTTALPGAYGAGTAGKIIGDNINATISSRATQTSVDAVKAVTDLLPNAGALTSLATAANLATVAGYIDTEVAAIKAKTDLIPAAPAAVGDIPTAAQIADAVLDDPVEGAVTLRQSARLWNSALGGKASGLETTEATYRDLADSKDRIVATVDVDGNRTAVTRDLT